MASFPVAESSTIDISADQDVVRVRQATRTLAVHAALSLVDQTKVVTAASEIARNTLIYGGGGKAVLELLEDGHRRGVRVAFSDDGPGVSDIGLALSEGYSTGGGLGLGLSGARRLVDQFELDSAPGEGTRVTLTKWGR